MGRTSALVRPALFAIIATHFQPSGTGPHDIRRWSQHPAGSDSSMIVCVGNDSITTSRGIRGYYRTAARQGVIDMSYHGHLVVDMDSHIREYWDLDRTYREYIDPKHAATMRRSARRSVRSSAGRVTSASAPFMHIRPSVRSACTIRLVAGPGSRRLAPGLQRRGAPTLRRAAHCSPMGVKWIRHATGTLAPGCAIWTRRTSMSA